MAGWSARNPSNPVMPLVPTRPSRTCLRAIPHPHRVPRGLRPLILKRRTWDATAHALYQSCWSKMAPSCKLGAAWFGRHGLILCLPTFTALPGGMCSTSRHLRSYGPRFPACCRGWISSLPTTPRLIALCCVPVAKAPESCPLRIATCVRSDWHAPFGGCIPPPWRTSAAT